MERRVSVNKTAKEHTGSYSPETLTRFKLYLRVHFRKVLKKWGNLCGNGKLPSTENFDYFATEFA